MVRSDDWEPVSYHSLAHIVRERLAMHITCKHRDSFLFEDRTVMTLLFYSIIKQHARVVVVRFLNKPQYIMW